jgi:hypothetical protein
MRIPAWFAVPLPVDTQGSPTRCSRAKEKTTDVMITILPIEGSNLGLVLESRRPASLQMQIYAYSCAVAAVARPELNSQENIWQFLLRSRGYRSNQVQGRT